MKLMVYSHDTYGLGNLRRMLAICQHLLENIPKLSILLISGSPMAHAFRMPQGLDYIKLPCVERDRAGQLAAKYLSTTTEEAIELRSALIKTAAIHFQPDLLLVDKKPYALVGELKNTLTYLKIFLPQTKVVLLLRDILDSPDKTIKEWYQNRYYEGIECFYDQVWVVGMSKLFDLPKEYQFPTAISKKVKFCGYIRRPTGKQNAHTLRRELQIQPEEKLVLVTSGGGGDGYNLVHNYLQGLKQLSARDKIKSLIVSGPEMSLHHQQALSKIAAKSEEILFLEFTDDLNSYMNAADVVVSMGGYNTVCEILSLNKAAVVVPRCQPVQEQWIRAERMAHLGLFRVIHPERLTPENLMQAVLEKLRDANEYISSIEHLVDLNALPRLTHYLSELLASDSTPRWPSTKQNKISRVA